MWVPQTCLLQDGLVFGVTIPPTGQEAQPTPNQASCTGHFGQTSASGIGVPQAVTAQPGEACIVNEQNRAG